MEQDIGRKKIFADIILVSALLIVSLSVFLIIEFTRVDGTYAVVTVDGREVARYSLSDDGEYSLNGGTNVLVIEDGKAYIKHATCLKEACKRQGKISRTGESIVCSPNRVMIEIVGAEDEIDFEI